jgi:hypothetical protein
VSGPVKPWHTPPVRALLDALQTADTGQRYLYRTTRDGYLQIGGERHAPLLTIRCGSCLGIYEEPLGDLRFCPHCGKFARGAA